MKRALLLHNSYSLNECNELQTQDKRNIERSLESWISNIRNIIYVDILIRTWYIEVKR